MKLNKHIKNMKKQENEIHCQTKNNSIETDFVMIHILHLADEDFNYNVLKNL